MLTACSRRVEVGSNGEGLGYAEVIGDEKFVKRSYPTA
jgi:hypothetical protein